MLDIIIVEDNKEIGTLLQDFLSREGFVVSVAVSGEKAVELFEMYGAKLVIKLRRKTQTLACGIKAAFYLTYT